MFTKMIERVDEPIKNAHGNIKKSLDGAVRPQNRVIWLSAVGRGRRCDARGSRVVMVMYSVRASFKKLLW